MSITNYSNIADSDNFNVSIEKQTLYQTVGVLIYNYNYKGDLNATATNCSYSMWILIHYNVAVNVYVLGVVCLLGLIGNVFAIIVLNRDDEKPKTTRFLLQTLAAVDGFYLALAIFIYPVDSLLHVYRDIEIWHYFWYFLYMAETSTVWMVLVVTVDRYIAVCLPWKVEWKELRRVRIAVAIVLITAALYSIPELMETLNLFGNFADEYFLIYHVICYAIFRGVGPLLALIVLNARLMREVVLMRKRHLNLTQHQAQPDNVTLILVVVVTVFLICQLPSSALRIALAIGIFGDCSSHNTLFVLYFASDALVVCNSSVNFIIYCVVGSRFRKILVEMIRCCGRQSSSASKTDSDRIS